MYQTFQLRQRIVVHLVLLLPAAFFFYVGFVDPFWFTVVHFASWGVAGLSLISNALWCLITWKRWKRVQVDPPDPVPTPDLGFQYRRSGGSAAGRVFLHMFMFVLVSLSSEKVRLSAQGKCPLVLS